MTAKYSMENVIHSDESSSSIQSAVGTPQEQSEPIMTELSLKTSSDMNAPAETSNPEATAFSEYKETNQYKYNQNADQHNLNPAACFRLAIVK